MREVESHQPSCSPLLHRTRATSVSANCTPVPDSMPAHVSVTPQDLSYHNQTAKACLLVRGKVGEIRRWRNLGEVQPGLGEVCSSPATLAGTFPLLRGSDRLRMSPSVQRSI